MSFLNIPISGWFFSNYDKNIISPFEKLLEILLWGLSSYKKLSKKRTLEGLEFKDSIGSYLKNLNS